MLHFITNSISFYYRALACARPSCCGDVIRCTMGKVVCLESDAQAITHSCI
ncbi:Hypothetical predicted protein [Pelobates cultripes]|uniref:Uncharacterized protein n=1 Tax=Pelobates cultripes TaxID=61616 RepID=A0AAD1WJQ1_PELCU|nr:Hypothetical predicted protein [Pelobates cultripes]